MVQIKCIDAAIGYDGKKIAEGISFEVESGDFLCIVGENGSGKTTFMKTLLGLNKVISGKIEFTDRVTGNKLGYLPQQSEEKRDFPITVEEVVRSGCVGSLGFRPFLTRSQKQTARDNMFRLGITSLAKTPFGRLSGGQKQKVLLARALCAVDDIILLDEPVSGLDPKATEDMYALVKELNENHGVTVIMITHDIAAAIKYSDKVLYMADKPIFFGSAQEYAESSVCALREEAKNG